MTNDLRKTLGLTDVFCISSGAMISSGIFVLPGIAYAQIGAGLFFAYLLAGICALIGTLATIELATAMPLSGGIYYYTGRSLGPLAGTVSGLLNWSAIALKSAFAIFGMAAVFNGFWGWDPLVTGIILTLIFLGVNLIGTKEAAWAQIIMVFLLFLVMGTYIVLGFPEVEGSRFSPLFIEGKGYSALFAEAAFVFVAFGGLLDVASVSEEVKRPRRNLPWGMISAIAVVTVVYVLSLIVTVGVMDGKSLAASMTPLADAAQKYYGTPGFWVVTFGAMMAFVTTANAGVMAAARFPFAMGRDKLIPEIFSRTYGSRKMPFPALFVTGSVMVVVQLLPLEQLVTVASTVIMLSFILTNLAVIILRESEIQNYRPSFRVPFYPITPIISIILFAVMIMELGMGSIQIALAIVIAGVILFFVFGRTSQIEYALMHLYDRIFKGKVSTHHGLENELREILRTRDGITVDSFDMELEQADVLIFENDRSFEELVKKVCALRKLHRWGHSLARRLIERERSSSTAITASVAIPHITVPTENFFHIVLVKSIKGIFFSETAPEVKTIAFLFCSENRRNDHLKALVAIAQIIQQSTFDTRWEQAQTSEQMRDLFLLSRRIRERSFQNNHTNT